MSQYNLNVKTRQDNNTVFLDIDLKNKFNILSKSIIDLSSQNINAITNNLSEIISSGSNYGTQIKGFLIERSYSGDSLEGSDYFIEYVDSKESNSIQVSIEDNSDKSRLRNIKDIVSLTNINQINSINYDVSYFEIPSEEIIKSKTLLTDFLLRQYFYSQGKAYSLTKMEKIAESVQNNNVFEETLELDFYKALTKAKLDNNSAVFIKDKIYLQPNLVVDTIYQMQNFLFKASLENYENPRLELATQKIYRYNRITNQQLEILNKKYKKNEYRIYEKNNNFYGYLLSRKNAKAYTSNKNFFYEIELTFNIYNNKSSNYIIEKKLIRL